MTSRITEIAATDPARAATFYQKVFDCTIDRLIDGCYRINTASSERPSWVVIVARPLGPAGDQPISVFKVADVEDVTRRVYRNGGTVLISTTGPHGKPISICHDTEGNRLSIEQADSKDLEPPSQLIRGERTH